MNVTEFELQATLRRLDRRGDDLKRRGYAYRNEYEFLLREGRFYKPGPHPPAIAQQAPRQCFYNAMLIAAVHDVPIVEGMAIGPLGGPPCHHAWNLSADDRAIDTTWGRPGLAYLGVRFSAWRANDATWHGDASILQDHARNMPVLREPWVPEASPGPVDGLLQKIAQDALTEWPEQLHQLGLADVDELVEHYRRTAVA